MVLFISFRIFRATLGIVSSESSSFGINIGLETLAVLDVFEKYDSSRDLARLRNKNEKKINLSINSEACPHHGFSELHQLDTFYNALNSSDQDSLNSTAGAIVAKVGTSSSTPVVSPDVAELKDMVKALLLEKKNQSQAPATIKAVEESCVTCGSAHSYRNCPATDGNVYRDNIQVYASQATAVNYNQGNTGYHPPMVVNQIRPPDFPPVQQNQGNNQNRYNQNQGNNFNQ
ncbi:hypothetical protein Tco_0090373 [Tanacetum coccineum]